MTAGLRTVALGLGPSQMLSTSTGAVQLMLAAGTAFRGNRADGSSIDVASLAAAFRVDWSDNSRAVFLATFGDALRAHGS